MSDDQPLSGDVIESADVPSNPEDVSSAARSCSVILIILAAFALIICIWVAIIIFK
jgi:hypothetical protein